MPGLSLRAWKTFVQGLWYPLFANLHSIVSRGVNWLVGQTRVCRRPLFEDTPVWERFASRLDDR